MANVEKRRVGATDIEVAPVALGCWPISGMTSLNVNDQDSLATLHSAVDAGVNFFDTAFCYGQNGESEKLIAKALSGRRTDVVIATKGGIHWDGQGKRHFNASPERLFRECEISLERLDTDFVDILYLHAPDPNIPIAESAGALLEIKDSGKARCIGASNLSFEQLQEFHQTCPLSAFQPHYNMLQREIESEIVPWCMQNDVSLMVYWPLLKGLLAGHLKRGHEFLPGDGRKKYPMFQGEEWNKNQDFVDDLRAIAKDADKTVSDLVINWTIHQPGITVALCGAKRAYQIEETAAAMKWKLSAEQQSRIELALQRRGPPTSSGAV